MDLAIRDMHDLSPDAEEGGETSIRSFCIASWPLRPSRKYHAGPAEVTSYSDLPDAEGHVNELQVDADFSCVWTIIFLLSHDKLYKNASREIRCKTDSGMS